MSNENWGWDDSNWESQNVGWGTPSTPSGQGWDDIPQDSSGVGTTGNQGNGSNPNTSMPQDSQWEDYAKTPNNTENLGQKFIPAHDAVYKSPLKEHDPKKLSVSYGALGLIIILVCIILAIIIFATDNDGKSGNPKPNVQQQTQQTIKPTESASSSTPGTSEGSVTLVEIPTDIYLNYTGDVLDASGTVINKTKYVLGHQVLYCITIRVAVGASAEDISYYCNYASYASVGVGDLVFIKYQQVSDGFISINSITK